MAGKKEREGKKGRVPASPNGDKTRHQPSFPKKNKGVRKRGQPTFLLPLVIRPPTNSTFPRKCQRGQKRVSGEREGERRKDNSLFPNGDKTSPPTSSFQRKDNSGREKKERRGKRKDSSLSLCAKQQDEASSFLSAGLMPCGSRGPKKVHKHTKHTGIHTAYGAHQSRVSPALPGELPPAGYPAKDGSVPHSRVNSLLQGIPPKPGQSRTPG